MNDPRTNQIESLDCDPWFILSNDSGSDLKIANSIGFDVWGRRYVSCYLELLRW